MMTSTPKIVVSTMLFNPDWGPTTVIRTDVAEELRKVKEHSGTDIAVCASGTLVRYLLLEGLLDELQLLVHPVLMGSGRRMFEDDGDQVALHLAGTRSHSNGVVALRYTRTR